MKCLFRDNATLLSVSQTHPGDRLCLQDWWRKRN